MLRRSLSCFLNMCHSTRMSFSCVRGVSVKFEQKNTHDLVGRRRRVSMKSANDRTPRSYLEVKGLHRLGDAVVGRRRDAVAADALEEAHRCSRARGSLVDGRRPVRVARARLGQPQGWGLPVEAQRCLYRRERVGHDACGCPAPLQRFYATAAARTHELDANRAGVCDMGVQARGLLPARAGRRGSRGGLRAAKRRPC